MLSCVVLSVVVVVGNLPDPDPNTKSTESQ
jgi:hypothetical protein